MRKHSNPVLVFVTATVLTVVLALGIAAVAGAYSPRQQSQQLAPPTPIVQVAIPAECFGGGEVTSSSCNFIAAARLAQEFKDATNKPDAMREVAKLLAQEAAKEGASKALVQVFPKGMDTGAMLDILEEEYQYTASMFDYFMQRIQTELAQDNAKAELLRKYALSDAQAVQSLRDQVFAQQRSYVDAAKRYLTANPGAPGVQFQCLTACQQLISAAQGVNVFDNQVPTSGTQNPPTGHGHTGLIVGGVLAGAGAAGAAAALAAKGGSCSSQENQCNSLVNECLNQHISSACSQINSVCTQSCQCQGFSGFNVNTGTCQ